jgi:hypothetical protein
VLGVAIGDVVHGAAKRVDLEHGLPLRSGQDAHGRMERASG